MFSLVIRIVLFITIGVLLSLASSCKSQKALTAEINATDSIKVVYQERIVYAPDTVLIEIPHQSSEMVTPDSASFLENDYALSMAWFANGLLHHTLELKPQTIASPILKPITTITTSTDHKAQFRETSIEYVERELTWWQKTRIYGFEILVALLALAVVVRHRKSILSLIPDFRRLIR